MSLREIEERRIRLLILKRMNLLHEHYHSFEAASVLSLASY